MENLPGNEGASTIHSFPVVLPYVDKTSVKSDTFVFYSSWVTHLFLKESIASVLFLGKQMTTVKNDVDEVDLESKAVCFR